MGGGRISAVSYNQLQHTNMAIAKLLNKTSMVNSTPKVYPNTWYLTGQREAIAAAKKTHEKDALRG